LSESASDSKWAETRKGLAGRIDALLGTFPHPWTRVLAALWELAPVGVQPVLVVAAGQSTYQPEVERRIGKAARLLAELATVQPRLSLVLIVEPEALRLYQERAPESRAKALLRESVISIPPATVPGVPERRESSLRLVDVQSKSLWPLFLEAVRAVESLRENARPEQIDRARSTAERFLFECLQSLPETAGLFRLNTTLGFRFGPHREIEADLVADSLNLVVEIDGYHHFQDPESYRRDRRKDLEFQKHGYMVVRVLAEDVVSRLEIVLDTILAMIAFRGGQAENSQGEPHE
jgi:very-short-patch-repair endonuclease